MKPDRVRAGTTALAALLIGGVAGATLVSGGAAGSATDGLSMSTLSRAQHVSPTGVPGEPDDASAGSAMGVVFTGGTNRRGSRAVYHRYVVPPGAHELLIRLRGGGGAGGTGEPASGGGQGAYVEAIVSVDPGEVLEVRGGDAGYGSKSGTNTSGLGSVVRDASTGDRVTAGGGRQGTGGVPLPEVPGACSIGFAGPGGMVVVNSGMAGRTLVIESLPGFAGGEACIGKAPLKYDNGAGGGEGRAGGGGKGSETGSSGHPGYALLLPLQ